MVEFCQSEWDEFPENKMHKIFLNLKDYTTCPRTNRTEEIVISRLRICHSSITLFIQGVQLSHGVQLSRGDPTQMKGV